MTAAVRENRAEMPPDRPAYVVRRRRTRKSARRRIHVRVVHPISTPQLLRDPLVRQSSPLRKTLTATRVLLMAIGLHIAVLLAFLLGNRFIERGARPPPRSATMVEIRNVVPPPPPKLEPEEIEGPIVDDFPEPASPELDAKPAKEPPSPQALATPDAEESASEQPLRRIIGLSLESTVEGGSGPSFATGTSRMGRTEDRAVDPNVASGRPKAPASGTSTKQSGTREQRVATRIPTQTGVFVKPRRTAPTKPPFPATLRAQGIEGDVLVRVKIAESGAITDVAILTSSGHAAFDEEARKAALSESFSPATKDGKPIAYTLTYSYRFRIED